MYSCCQQAAQLNGNGDSTIQQQAAAAAGISRPSGSIATLPNDDVSGMQLDGIQLEEQQQPTGLYVRVSSAGSSSGIRQCFRGRAAAHLCVAR
jgi:hypothetical protein